MGKKRAVSWPRRATHIYANTQIMTVWYDVDIISESTRWQCHGFLLIVSWNIRFLLKYLNVTGKFIIPILKNLEKLLGHLLYFQKPTMRNDFLKKRQKPLCEDEEPGFLWGICRVAGRSALGACTDLCRMLNLGVIVSWPEIRTSYPESRQSSKPIFIFSCNRNIKKEWQFLSISVLFRTSYPGFVI